MAKKKDAFTAQTASPPPTDQPVVTIPLQIAMNVIGIIDMLSSRGAIKGEELFAVGFTRQQINDAVQPHLTPQE